MSLDLQRPRRSNSADGERYVVGLSLALACVAIGAVLIIVL